MKKASSLYKSNILCDLTPFRKSICGRSLENNGRGVRPGASPWRSDKCLDAFRRGPIDSTDDSGLRSSHLWDQVQLKTKLCGTDNDRRTPTPPATRIPWKIVAGARE